MTSLHESIQDAERRVEGEDVEGGEREGGEDVEGGEGEGRGREGGEGEDVLEDEGTQVVLSLSRAVAAKDSQLSVVDLSHFVLTLRHVMLLSHAFIVASIGGGSHVSPVHTLDLSHTGLEDDFLIPLAETMPRWIYRHGYINRENASARRGIGLTLRRLNLSYNQITARGANMLLDMLHLIASIGTINLEGNPCSASNGAHDDKHDDPCALIAYALAAKNPTPDDDDNDDDAGAGKREEERGQEEVAAGNNGCINANNPSNSDNEDNNGNISGNNLDNNNEDDQATGGHVVSEPSVPVEGGNEALVDPIAIPARTEIASVDLSGLQLGDSGIQLLLAALMALASSSLCHIVHLILTGNNITVRGARMLADYLLGDASTSITIQTLQLDYNTLQSDGVVALAEALATANRDTSVASSSLKALFVARNSCGDEGALALARAIRLQRVALDTVSVLGNGLSADGVGALADVYLRLAPSPEDEVMDHNIWMPSSLGILHLGDNPRVGDEGCRLLAFAVRDFVQHQLLSQAPALETTGLPVRYLLDFYLSLWRCGITDEGALLLLNALEPLYFQLGEGGNEQDKVPVRDHAQRRLLELDLEWNEAMESESVKQQWVRLKHQWTSVQKRRKREEDEENTVVT